MGLPADLVGRTFARTRVLEVGREDIRAFAAAVGSADPAHTDPAHARALGYRDVVAPPTYVVKVAQMAEAAVIADPSSGIDLSRVVHGEQRFAHHRAVVSGDALVAETTVDAVREAGGHAMVTTRAEVTTTGGEPVATVTSTIVVRGEP